MFKALAIGSFLMTVLAQGQGPAGTLVVPLKIEAVPARTFGRGKPVVLKMTMARNRVPATGTVCGEPAFVVRIYDAALVATNPPRISRDNTHPPGIPVTPYLQETGVARDPLDGTDPLKVEKVFPAFELRGGKSFKPARVYAGLFLTCTVAKPKDVDQTMGTIIYDDELGGSYIGGAFFKADCVTVPGQCWYRPE